MKILLALIVSCAAVVAADDTASPAVSRETYAGWTNALTLRGGDIRLTVVPSAGGRVVHYSLNGENLFYENTSAAGKTLATVPNFNPGGAQMDIGPELRGIPRHNNMWVGEWLGGTPRPNSIFVVSPAEMSVGVQMEKEFTIDPQTGDVGVIHRLRNVVTNDVSFCFWDRTLCKAGGYALIPLNKKSRFKARWAMRRGDKVENYTYDGDKPSDPRARVIDGVLVVQAKDLPEARFLKVGADSDAGWIAYTRGKLLYVKHFPIDRKGTYTDGGCNTEFYCDARLAEVEPLSPEYMLKPGGTVEFPEKWTLLELPQEATTFEKARELVKRIPKSPFGK
jgi:hypothetical protein